MHIILCNSVFLPPTPSPANLINDFSLALISCAFMGITGNKSALWGTTKSLKSVPYTQGFYVTRYFYEAYNITNIFLD